MSRLVRLPLLSSILALGVALAVWPGVAGAGGAPPNDDFPGTPINSLPFEVTLDTSAATAEGDEPVSFCAYEATNTVWWSFTAIETQVLIAEAEGVAHPPVLAIWKQSGFGGGGLVELNCDGDPGFPDFPDFPGYPPRLQVSAAFQAEAGSTYYIQLGGYQELFFPFGAAGAGYAPGGSVTFSLMAPAPPANDHIANAEVIGSLPFTDETGITAATTEPGEPQPSCLLEEWNEQPWSTIWYEFTPSNDAEILIDSSFSDVFMFVAVWTGSPGNLQEVACNGGIGALEVLAGTKYYIQAGEIIDDFFPPMGGTIRLLIREWDRPQCADPVQSFADGAGDTLGTGPFQPDFAVMGAGYTADSVCLTFSFNEIAIGTEDPEEYALLFLLLDLDGNPATGAELIGEDDPCLAPGQLGIEAVVLLDNSGLSDLAGIFMFGLVPVGAAAIPLASVEYGDDSISVAMPLGPLGDSSFTVQAKIGTFEELTDCLPNSGGVDVQGPPVIRFGDVNCSGQVNESDVRDLLRYAGGIYSGVPVGCTPMGEPLPMTYPVSGQALIAGDVNCDADVDALDALALLLHLTGHGQDGGNCPIPGSPPVQ